MPTLGAGGELESTTVSLTTLTRHLERALDLFADVFKNPSFPDKELDRLKLQRLAQLKARADDPEQTAAAVFPRLIYGLDHPYGRPDLGTPGSVQSITRDDVVAFYKRIMVPGNAALVVVGDVRPMRSRPRSRLACGPGRPARSRLPPRCAAGVPAAAAALPDRQAGRGPVGPDRRARSAPPASRPISTP